MTKEIPVVNGKERIRLPEEQRGRQNYPIQSEIQGERIYEAEPVDETCWAYMKLLRETNKTKKIYPINPYVEVYQFRDNLYALYSMSLDGMGDAWMYLTIGPDKAFLVDTSFGLGNLKGLVDGLTGGKEVIVVNTHCHYDHAYGNAQFERVYCHEYEVPNIAAQDERIWDYLFEEGSGRGIWAEFPKEDLIAYKPYDVVGVPDGYQWDLGGGYRVELIFLGGHSCGHAGFLDKQNKIFFAGDDIISMRVGVNGPRPGNPYGKYATVTTLCENLKRLEKRMDEFDHVFTGHFVTDLESSVVTNMRKACEEVLADPLHNYTYTSPGRKGQRYFKHVEGLGTLQYLESSV